MVIDLYKVITPKHARVTFHRICDKLMVLAFLKSVILNMRLLRFGGVLGRVDLTGNSQKPLQTRPWKIVHR